MKLLRLHRLKQHHLFLISQQRLSNFKLVCHNKASLLLTHYPLQRTGGWSSMCHRGGLQTFVHKKNPGRTAALLFWPPTTAASLKYQLPALLARTTMGVQALAGTFHTWPEQGSTLGKSMAFLKENIRDCHRTHTQEWVSPEESNRLQQQGRWEHQPRGRAWPWSEGTQWHETEVVSSPEDF